MNVLLRVGGKLHVYVYVHVHGHNVVGCNGGIESFHFGGRRLKVKVEGGIVSSAVPLCWGLRG